VRRKMNSKMKNKKKLKIREIEQTCSACPSQWEATLDDGRMLYFRYRWGVLRISISERPTRDIMDAVGGNEIFMKVSDEDFCVLEYAEMKEITKHIIEYPK